MPPAGGTLSAGMERGTHTFLGARHLGVKPPIGGRAPRPEPDSSPRRRGGIHMATEYTARHRRVSSRRIAVGTLAVGALTGVAAVLAPASPASAASVNWDAIAQCESGGNWHIN